MHDWKLQVFDHSGQIIGTITKHTGGPFVMQGTPDALHCCLRDLRNVPGFCPDTQTIAAQLYEEFCRQYGFASGLPATWDKLAASPAHAPLASRWLAIAEQARRTIAQAN